MDLSTGGGVLVALRRDITFEYIVIDDLSTLVPLIDVVVCKCTIAKNVFYIVGIYVPPAIHADELGVFLDAISVLLLDYPVLFVGDFNIPNFLSLERNDPKVIVMDGFMATLNLSQLNTVLNVNGKLLDLIFSNVPFRISVEREGTPLVREDTYHPALSVTLFVLDPPARKRFPSNANVRYNFRRANYMMLYHELFLADWSDLTGTTDINSCLDLFYSKLYTIMNGCIPTYCCSGQRGTYPVWFTGEIKQNLRQKKYYHRRWKTTGRLCFYQQFSRLRNLTKIQIDTAYKSFIRQAEQNVRRDPRQLWQYIRLREGISRIPPTMHDGANFFEEPNDVVNEFARIFSSTYLPPSDMGRLAGQGLSYDSFGIPIITDDDILTSIQKLKPTTTAGEDQIPSFLIKDCRMVLLYPLKVIFNLSMKTCEFPTRWKLARVCPILKKGDKSDLRNYRPISILSNLAKVFEQILYGYIFNNIHRHISPVQHGFMRGKSTVTNLLCITQDICSAIDCRSQLDVVYTDFARAFDTVDHGILLDKLHRFGFNSNLHKLMSSYLSERISCVYYNGYKSNDFVATSGVPQGSNLGPLLFLIFVNDLLESLSCSALAYADDLKIYARIDSPMDAQLLQHNIDVISNWCINNKIRLNIDKCCIVQYARTRDPLRTDYSIDNQILRSESEITDLGVVFDSQLTFTNHIINTCRSASRSLGFVMRSSKYFINIHVIWNLYCALVRSRMEYACVIWSPIYIYQELMLERVQRRCIKFLCFRRDGVYPPRGTDQALLLADCNVEALKTRREKIAANFLYDLIHNVLSCPSALQQIQFSVPRVPSRHAVSFHLPRCRTNVMVRSPIYQVCKCANKLFDDIIFESRL